MYMYIYICIYIYTYAYIYIYLRMYMYIYIYTHIHTSIYIFIYIWVYTYICIYTCTCVYVHICIRIHKDVSDAESQEHLALLVSPLHIYIHSIHIRIYMRFSYTCIYIDMSHVESQGYLVSLVCTFHYIDSIHIRIYMRFSYTHIYMYTRIYIDISCGIPRISGLTRTPFSNQHRLYVYSHMYAI